jgi:hypothetical protein
MIFFITFIYYNKSDFFYLIVINNYNVLNNNGLKNNIQ